MNVINVTENIGFVVFSRQRLLLREVQWQLRAWCGILSPSWSPRSLSRLEREA